MKNKRQPNNVIPLPPDWKSSFQGHAMRTSFCLALTQPMLEFLCATAEGVHWDRRLYSRQFGIARPDNWLASSGSLIKRGLIERISQAELDEEFRAKLFQGDSADWLSSHYRLTPAGEALVQLLKVTGIFVESDTALARHHKFIDSRRRPR